MSIKPLDILHKYYGYTSFRKGQENIITSMMLHYSMTFLIAWSLMLIVWVSLGIQVGF